MDLMKLLKLKKTEAKGLEPITDPGSTYLASLAQMLRNDIASLSTTQSNDEWVRLIRIMKVFVGKLSEKQTSETPGNCDYLFLNVPSTRGFMLELTKNGRNLELRRGTLIVPIKRNVFEELEQSTLYVTSPRIIANYEILSHDLVRDYDPVRTYSVEVMSEWLLSLALGVVEPIEKETQAPLQ